MFSAGLLGNQEKVVHRRELLTNILGAKNNTALQSVAVSPGPDSESVLEGDTDILLKLSKY